MKQILITGAAGFIGSHLCERLLSEYKIIAVDNLSLGKKENINHLRNNLNFKFYECDILNQKEFENIFRMHTIDVIFHLAANSDIANSNAKLDFQNTLSTTLVVLEKCKIKGIKEFIFTSSGAVYGEGNIEWSESMCGLPISHYAAAKIASEAYISSYSSMYNIQSWIYRFPNVVGDHVTHGAIYDFINRLRINPKELKVLGNGTQKKPYLYVKDCIDAMIFIWQNAKEKINIYNISGIGQTSVKEIAEMVINQMGLDTAIKYTERDRGWDGDVPQYKCDISKLEALGWLPKRKSNESVKIAIKNILKNDYNSNVVQDIFRRRRN